MRSMVAVRYDVLFQVRHGFYYVYLITCALYVVALRSLPQEALVVVLPIVIFSDPALLGLFFIGGIVLLERGQRTIEGLFVTPLTVSEYLWAKTLSLSLLALCTSLLVAIVGGQRAFNPLLLVLGVLLCSVPATLSGLAIGARMRSVNWYLLSASFFIVVLCVPVLPFTGLIKGHWLFYLFPSRAGLLLINGAYQGIGTGDLIYALAYLLVVSGAAWYWARTWFGRYVIRQIGGEQ